MYQLMEIFIQMTLSKNTYPTQSLGGWLLPTRETRAQTMLSWTQVLEQIYPTRDNERHRVLSKEEEKK